MNAVNCGPLRVFDTSEMLFLDTGDIVLFVGGSEAGRAICALNKHVLQLKQNNRQPTKAECDFISPAIKLYTVC